jgi:nitrate/TMAO reductase-like tetraheme cytochrome c subunit
MSEKHLLLWRNRMTYVGAVVAAVAALFMLSFLFFDIVSGQGNPYISLFTYLIFPGFLVIGLVLMVIGLWRARRCARTQPSAPVVGPVGQYYPRIDLNLPSHRRVLATVGVVTALALPVIGLMSYQGYHYTDSNEFCGLVCHSVMEPQYTAHRHSPHARVECAECHIGAGASWYVKSKLSGVRQIFAVALDTYSKPIPAAIHELRPATETCQQCHWPAKFYGDQLITLNRFAADEASTPLELRMLVKTGGSDVTAGPPSGIHWHMALGHRIEYVATDHELQDIPWIQATDFSTNKTTVYRSDGKPADAPPPPGTRRTVDCMDCHNRATHVFRSPAAAADTTLVVNPDLRSLPFAKRELVKAVVAAQSSEKVPLDAGPGEGEIARQLEAFYKEHYPEALTEKRAELNKLIAAGREIHQRNAFPGMNVTWRSYPDNIGHKNFPGCFRCHDGEHVNAEGVPIRRDCAICHEFLVPAGEGASGAVRVAEFQHPTPLEGVHETMRCDKCHTGGVAPPTTCADCHAEVQAFRAGTTPELARFGIEPEPMLDGVDCADCHPGSKRVEVAALDAACVECHDEDYAGMVGQWMTEAKELLEKGTLAPTIREAIRRAGPAHNIEAVRRVVEAQGQSASATKPTP